MRARSLWYMQTRHHRTRPRGPLLDDHCLVLVDGNALAYRCYYGTRNNVPLTDPAGRPVGCLFTFCKSLLGIIAYCEPRALAVCFDTPTRSFRSEIFPA